MLVIGPRKSSAAAALKLFLFALLSVHFSYNYLKVNQPFLDIQQYIAGYERSPFQYRILMAPVFSGLLSFFDHLSPAVMAFKRPSFLQNPESLAHFLVSVLAYGASVLLFDKISRRLFAGPTALLCLAIYIVMTYVFFDLNPVLSFLLPYDMPTLMFSNALLLLFIDRRWLAMSLVFIIATINRETSFVLIFVVLANAAFTDNPSDRKASVLMGAALSLLWLVVKIALSLLIRHARVDRVGEDNLHGLVYNVSELLKPWDWPAVAAVYIAPLMACSLLAKSKQSEVRTWAVAGLAAFLVFFVMANTTEQRAFGEVIGLFAIIGALFVQRTALPHPATPESALARAPSASNEA